MKIGWELLLSRKRLFYYSFAWVFQYYQMILLNKSIKRYSPACVHIIAMFAVKSVGKSLQAFTFFPFNLCLSVLFTSMSWCYRNYFYLKHWYGNYISISYMLLLQSLVKLLDKMSDYRKISEFFSFGKKNKNPIPKCCCHKFIKSEDWNQWREEK